MQRLAQVIPLHATRSFRRGPYPYLLPARRSEVPSIEVQFVPPPDPALAARWRHQLSMVVALHGGRVDFEPGAPAIAVIRFPSGRLSETLRTSIFAWLHGDPAVVFVRERTPRTPLNRRRAPVAGRISWSRGMRDE